MSILIDNISQLITLKGEKGYRKGKNLCEIGLIENAALLIENEFIVDYGFRDDILKNISCNKNLKYIDAGKRVVMPSFVDCHTHSVFAKPRIEDFEKRIKGMSYLEIKRSGGGINLSAKHIKESSIDELSNKLLRWLNYFVENGTLTLEIKSGYGLDLENELKILRAIKSVLPKTELDIVSTFLGAHSIPEGFDSKSYLDYLKKEVLPIIKKENLAKFVDIFCEYGYFNVEESIEYLSYARDMGFVPRVHAEQLTKFGGSLVAAQVRAKTADHLDFADDEYIEMLSKNEVACVFLPASNYFLGIDRYPDARKFIEKGCVIALATDFNPGTSPCWNMQFVISLALVKMKMTIEQSIVASIYNPAYILGFEDKIGMIDKGMQADLIILDIEDYRELGYYFGSNLNWMSIKKGKILWKKENLN